jgi:DNA processing protein
LEKDELFYRIALTMIPNIGPVLAKNLLAYCGSAENVFKQKLAELSKIPGIGTSKAQDVVNANVFGRAEVEMAFVEKYDIKVLFYLDDLYPGRLKHFDYSPLLLYYRGDVAYLNALRTIGIVGTRKPSERGKMFTEKLVEDIIPFNAVVVSGLAYGVDGIAHKQAVKMKIPTIGIMGNSHDLLYPAEHKELASKMLNCGGLITEFPSNTKPDRANFPMRNRIIAALSDALVVVESNISGGSIITAEFANEYNKDVFALPGRIDDEKSKGCNALIKRHKAHLIESIDDLAYITRWDELSKKKTVQASLFIELDEEEQKLIDFIRSKKEASIDEIIYHLNLSSSIVASQLLTLEFKGILRALPGKKYMLG